MFAAGAVEGGEVTDVIPPVGAAVTALLLGAVAIEVRFRAVVGVVAWTVVGLAFVAPTELTVVGVDSVASGCTDVAVVASDVAVPAAGCFPLLPPHAATSIAIVATAAAGRHSALSRTRIFKVPLQSYGLITPVTRLDHIRIRLAIKYQTNGNGSLVGQVTFAPRRAYAVVRGGPRFRSR